MQLAGSVVAESSGGYYGRAAPSEEALLHPVPVVAVVAAEDSHCPSSGSAVVVAVVVASFAAAAVAGPWHVAVEVSFDLGRAILELAASELAFDQPFACYTGLDLEQDSRPSAGLPVAAWLLLVAVGVDDSASAPGRGVAQPEQVVLDLDRSSLVGFGGHFVASFELADVFG